MKGLTGLLWLQKRNREFNGWFADSTNDYYLEGATNEIAEIHETLKSGDHDELELEVGDLLWDVLSLINKLDGEGLIDMDRVCPRAVAKFSERMPYNVDGYYEGDMSQREIDWKSAKVLQKSRGIDENHPMALKVWEAVSNEDTDGNK